MEHHSNRLNREQREEREKRERRERRGKCAKSEITKQLTLLPFPLPPPSPLRRTKKGKERERGGGGAYGLVHELEDAGHDRGLPDGGCVPELPGLGHGLEHDPVELLDVLLVVVRADRHVKLVALASQDRACFQRSWWLGGRR